MFADALLPNLIAIHTIANCANIETGFAVSCVTART